jgi:hypothetical protein
LYPEKIDKQNTSIKRTRTHSSSTKEEGVEYGQLFNLKRRNASTKQAIRPSCLGIAIVSSFVYETLRENEKLVSAVSAEYGSKSTLKSPETPDSSSIRSCDKQAVNSSPLIGHHALRELQLIQLPTTMSTYQRVVLANRPKAGIVPGETFRVETAQAPRAADLKDGEVLIETRYLSLDPAMRGWMSGAYPFLTINTKPPLLLPILHKRDNKMKTSARTRPPLYQKSI